MKLLKIHKDMFESISIDSIFLYINGKKIRLDNDLSIYQQTFAYLKGKKLGVDFTKWLHIKYDVDFEDELPDKVIQDWEMTLHLNSKSVVYTKALRIMYKPNNHIEFYGLTSGNSLEYLTNTKHTACFRALIHYLQYSLYCEQLYQELKVQHTLEKSNKMITDEIKLCLRYKLIPIVKNIKVISNSPKEYCLAYYNLNQGNKTKHTPAWDSFISTLNNNGSRECFKGFLYSIFVDNNFGRQVLWLFGRGNTGKTRVSEAIANRLLKINGLICANIPDKMYADKFTSSAYVNKRFLKAPDTKDRALLRTQDIKNITGNDTKTIRRIFQEETSQNVYAKVMATSNYRPWVDCEKEEEISRCLFISVDSKAAYEAHKAWDSKEMGDWAMELSYEFDDFIAKCKDDYFKVLQPDGHNIKPYPEMEAELQKGDFYIRRDMTQWWEHCIKPYKPSARKNEIAKKTKMLTIGELVDDYNRFIYPANKHGKTTQLIRRFMITHLRGLEIPIYDLTSGNTQYIKGYDLVNDQTTLASLLMELRGYVENEQVEHDEIYG